MISGPSSYPCASPDMDASGRRRQPATRRGFCQKAYEGLPLRGILDTAHRHPESRKRFGGIGQESVEPAGIPIETFIARLAQCRGIIEGRVAADLASDQAGEIGAGHSPFPRIKAVAGAARVEQARAIFLRGGRRQQRKNGEEEGTSEKSQRSAARRITTSRT